MLRRIGASDVAAAAPRPFDDATLHAARAIVEDVRRDGEHAVRRYAERFGELAPGEDLIAGPELLAFAGQELDASTRSLIDRTAEQIRRFADAQRTALGPFGATVPGGGAGHDVVPVESAACYAPGGRHPLPSTVLMTAVTARAAGVGRVVVASPKAGAITLAAAGVAGADAVLRVGGAHAVAAMAFGIEGLDPCDVIVGPGNRWVTAAKHVVSAFCGIDMLAGPSELLVLADDSADPRVVAADLLAQAEHDDDAVPMLAATSGELAEAVERELASQLESLPTAPTARRALSNGFCCVVGDEDGLVRVADAVAAEHLEILTHDPERLARRITHAGAVFLGSSSAEVFGDYGVGPNHTLPTGRTARVRGGLSVLDFLRVRTWLRIDPASPEAARVRADAAALARLEGLEAHARAAEIRSALPARL
jgi:phosphoribosyl-ATP pyrophosphohydrolase/phosphoribosyl-AMP cyclohydrolase/histidinol dehydrogenase